MRSLIDLSSTFSSKKSAVARASEDFMPREPTFQTLHIASVAFNSLLLGEIVVPDWDMFHVRIAFFLNQYIFCKSLFSVTCLKCMLKLYFITEQT